MSLCVEFNNEDFEYFKEKTIALIAKHGLYDWDVQFVFGLPDDVDSDCLVGTRGNYEAMSATIYFPRTCDSIDVVANTREELITKCAKHEIAELMTLGMQVLAQRRAYDPRMMEMENHRLVHRLERLL